MLGFLFGTGTLRSYEGTKSYALADIESVTVYAHLAQVRVVPSQTDYRAEVYAKAWLAGPIDFDKIFAVHADSGAFNVTETPFPAEFLGVFPQPYEMRITLYLPADASASMKEVRQ